MNKKIKLQETENCFFIKNIFPHKIIAGFTKTPLFGRLPSDFHKLIPYIGNRSYPSRLAFGKKRNIRKFSQFKPRLKENFQQKGQGYSA